MLTDEKFRKLDIIPQIFPDFLLRRSLDVYKVTSDLDMRAIYNRQVGSEFLYKRYEPLHLRIIFSYTRIPTGSITGERLHYEDKPMKAISMPPGASGPPSAVHLRQFFLIHASN
jgi:hypothetical protein